MITIGIDPGQTGAAALVDTWNSVVLQLADLPVVARPVGKGMQLDPRQLARMLNAWCANYPTAQVVVERVRAMPATVGGIKRKMGAQSMFNFGETAGVIRAVVELTGAPYTYVEPATWKRRAMLIGLPKDASRVVAAELYPNVARKLARKKDHGRAEAILLATFGISDYPPGADLL